MATVVFYMVFAFIAFVCFYFWHRYSEIRRFPPGPWGLPIIGYLPWIDQNMYRMPREASKKYGPVFSVQLGQYLVVFLHGYDVAKEALLKYGDVFSGRPNLFWMVYTNKGMGIVPSDGEEWKTIRRYTASSLRDFGMGKLSLEGKIHEEIQHLFDRIDDQGGRPFRSGQMITNAVCNIFSSVLYGKRFDYDDPLFKRLIYIATEVFGRQHSMILNWLPWLSHFPPFNSDKRLLDEYAKPFFKISYDAMEKAERILDNGQKPSNFVEALTNEIRQGGTRAETLKQHCVYTINQLFLAATETTTTTMDWGLLLLIMNPDVQKNMQDELDRVVGRDRLPSWEDRTRLPYTEATAYEVLRMSNFGPLSLPHRCMETINFKGYVIPKDAVVFYSIGSWSTNEKHFPDALKFDPNHFLTPEGKVDYKKPMAPFGMGKRECVGEALAKMEIFAFLSCLMQRYTFKSAPGQNLVYLEGAERKLGWATHPEPYEIIAVRR